MEKGPFCQLVKFTKVGIETAVLFFFSSPDTYNDILGDVSRQTPLLVCSILPNKSEGNALPLMLTAAR